MARGLTHPTAHVGKKILDVTSKTEYVYDGFSFSQDVESLTKGYSIIKTINAPIKSGALFKFSKSGKKYGVIYYSRSVSSASNISAKTLNMQYLGRKGATENLGITSDTLIKGGKIEKRVLNGIEVSCSVFHSKQELVNSVMTALKNNPRVGAHIYDVCEDFFKSDLKKFNWNSEFIDSDINELGKYLGELLIGVCVLGGSTSSVISGTNPFMGKKVKEFIVPNDPSFSGVDSAFICEDGTIIPISSKLGAGAKASLFTNLLPKILKYNKSTTKTIIGDIAEAAKNVNITVDALNAKRGSKEIVYEYGIRDILGIPQNVIRNTYDIFLDIKKNPNNLTDQAKMVVSAIRNSNLVEQNVKEKLPLSTTAAFNRTIAKRLNTDPKSIDLIKNVLGGKKFYQANLDLTRWKRGEISFRLLASGSANVSFVGSKAAIDDLEAKQGLVNYELRF